MILIGYIGALLWGAACLLLSLFVYKLGVPKKYTRKIVHILVGAEWFILYHTMGVGIHFLAVCLIFTVMLLVSYKKSLMPMISSDSDNAPGTVYYGVSMSVMATVSCFLPNFIYAFGIAVLCTSVGDGFASVIGNLFPKHNPKIYKGKSLFGTLAAFIFSFASVMLFAWGYNLGLGVLEAVCIALLAAGLELVTGFGLDNISLPFGVSAFAYCLLFVEGTMGYAIPVVFTPYIIAFALGKGVLTKSGVAAAVLLDVGVSIPFGNFGFVLLLTFLLASVAIDKLKKHVKGADDGISKRGDKRDIVQVIANGAIPLICAILYFIFRNGIFIVAYSAALGECFADTAASGVGMLSKKAYDPIRFKRVQVGMSGGMSVLGTAASLLAALVICLIPLAFGVMDFRLYTVAFLSAFAGAVFDSILGSLAQAKYLCKLCGKYTEREVHCDEKTELIGGLRFVNNDVVNIVSVAFSAILAGVVSIFM